MSDRMTSRQEWEKAQRQKWEQERRVADMYAVLATRKGTIRRNGWNVGVTPERISLYIPSNTRPKVLEQQLEDFKKKVDEWCGENRIKPIEVWVSITGGEPFQL